MHRRRGAGGDDEREETERLVLGAVERVLADAAAHLAGLVGRGAGVRQPAVGFSSASNAGRSASTRAATSGTSAVEPARLSISARICRRVDEEAEVMVMVVSPRSHIR